MAKLQLKGGRQREAQRQGASVDQEEVAKLAYELYLKRGAAHGSDWSDWFEAETQLKKT